MNQVRIVVADYVVYKEYQGFPSTYLNEFISELSVLLLTHNIDRVVHVLGVGISPQIDPTVPQDCILVLSYVGSPLDEYLMRGPPGGQLRADSTDGRVHGVDPAGLLYYILPMVIDLLHVQDDLQHRMRSCEGVLVDVKPGNLCILVDKAHGDFGYLRATVIDVEGIM